jgi:hypothetical protein
MITGRIAVNSGASVVRNTAAEENSTKNHETVGPRRRNGGLGTGMGLGVGDSGGARELMASGEGIQAGFLVNFN